MDKYIWAAFYFDKPNPFASLNHFTLPFAMTGSLQLKQFSNQDQLGTYTHTDHLSLMLQLWKLVTFMSMYIVSFIKICEKKISRAKV